MNQCKLKLLDAFAGIGGFSYAAERLVGGFETKQFIEIDPYCQSVLKKNFPNVPIHNDITTFQSYQGEYDILTAGFPCQDLSVAGSQKGIGEGTRSGLFYEVMRLVRLIRPRFVLLENVRNLISHQQGKTFQEILFQIAKAGYDAEWSIVSARDVGACHKRERIWIIAYPKHDGLPPSKEQGIHDQASNRDETRQDTTLQSQGSSQPRGNSTLRGTEGDEESTSTNSDSERPQGLRTQSELREGSPEKKASWFGGRLDEQPANPMRSGLEGQIRPRFPGSIRWQTPPTSRCLNPQWREYLSEPTLRRGDDGLSNRVPRLKALGNTIVPACAAVPLQRIKHLSTYPTITMSKEASLEPLNSKEVEQFLEGQRRAQQDSEWRTSTGVKQTMAKLEKLQKKRAAAKLRKPTFREAWANRFTHQLLGRTITGLRYMTKEECDDFGWSNSTLVLVLSLGSRRDPDTDIFLIPQMDDEGNDAGVLNFTPITPKKWDLEKFEELAPVLPSYDLEKTDHWMNEKKK